MLAQIKTVFSKQKEAILLDMIGCVSLFIIHLQLVLVNLFIDYKQKGKEHAV